MNRYLSTGGLVLASIFCAVAIAWLTEKSVTISSYSYKASLIGGAVGCIDGRSVSSTVNECAHLATDTAPIPCEAGRCIKNVFNTYTCNWGQLDACNQCTTSSTTDGQAAAYQTVYNATVPYACNTSENTWVNWDKWYTGGCNGTTCGLSNNVNVSCRSNSCGGTGWTADPNYTNYPRGGAKQKAGC